VGTRELAEQPQARTHSGPGGVRVQFFTCIGTLYCVLIARTQGPGAFKGKDQAKNKREFSNPWQAECSEGDCIWHDFGLWSIEFAVTLSSTGAINRFKEMTPATSGVIAEVSPVLPYPEPLRVTGPLQSLVLRAEDMWRKHNQCHRSWQGSQSGFPLLTLKCPFLCSAPSTKVLNTVHSWWR
jgi:hypothetical protein